MGETDLKGLLIVWIFEIKKPPKHQNSLLPVLVMWLNEVLALLGVGNGTGGTSDTLQ